MECVPILPVGFAKINRAEAKSDNWTGRFEKTNPKRGLCPAVACAAHKRFFAEKTLI